VVFNPHECCVVAQTPSSSSSVSADYPPKAGVETFDYLVKWQGLPYSECTQEDNELIKQRYPAAIEEYEMRQKSTCTPSKNCKVRTT